MDPAYRHMNRLQRLVLYIGIGVLRNVFNRWDWDPVRIAHWLMSMMIAVSADDPARIPQQVEGLRLARNLLREYLGRAHGAGWTEVQP